MFKKLLKPSAGAGEEAQALIAAGNAAEDAGRLPEALALYRRAVACAPQLPGAHLNLGIAQEALGDAAAARACYGQVLALVPGHPFGAYNLGKLDYLQGRLQEAQAHLRTAVAGKPDFHEAWVLLANTLDALGRLQEAFAASERAVQLRPESAGALGNHAALLQRLGRLDEAGDAAAEAARLAPGSAEHLEVLATVRSMQGFAGEALAALRSAIALQPQRLDLVSKELFLMNLLEGIPAQELWQRHRAYGERLEASVGARARPPRELRKPRLRVGFVSGELRTHPVSLFLLPVLERRDRARFEVACYSSGTRADHVTERLRASVDRWVDASAWNDAQLAEAIAADGIDLLVDLDGHTSSTRLAAFAARPAPVQLAWVGYLNTTGLSRMDFRITDSRCDPPPSQALHSEKLLHLPHSQWCYRPFLEVPCAAQAPCERQGFVTFGSFNNVGKLTPQMAARWGRILRAVPDARLLFAGVDSHRKREELVGAVTAAGVAADRVRFAPRADLPGYYRLMDEVDIALDSHPYGGGTTTFDALWMGVPVLTAAGETPCSRSAASVLAQLGLDAWIARDIDAYEALAIARAADRASIAQLRRTLRATLRASPLMDEAGFTAAFESLLERAWQEVPA